MIWLLLSPDTIFVSAASRSLEAVLFSFPSFQRPSAPKLQILSDLICKFLHMKIMTGLECQQNTEKLSTVQFSPVMIVSVR